MNFQLLYLAVTAWLLFFLNGSNSLPSSSRAVGKIDMSLLSDETAVSLRAPLDRRAEKTQAPPMSSKSSKSPKTSKRIKRDPTNPFPPPPLASDGPVLYCDHEGYFNPSRWSESDAGKAYAQWTMVVNKTSKAWQNRVSEPDFFLRSVMGWSDMDCGVTYKGCVRMPTCDQILSRVRDRHIARQIYFVILSVNNINLISGVVNDQSEMAQMNVASMSSSMAHTFFWRHSAEMEHLCKLGINIIKGLVAALVLGTLLVAPVALAGTTAVTELAAAEGIWVEAEQTAAMAAEAAEEAMASEALAVSRQIASEVAKEGAVLGETTVVAGEAAGIAGEVSGAAEEASSIIGEAPELLRDWPASVESVKKFAEGARIQAVMARTKALEKAKVVFEKALKPINLNAPKVYRPPWSLTRLSKGGRKMFDKLGTPKGAVIPIAFAGFPMGVAGNDVEAKFCALYPNVPADAEQWHKRQVDKYVQQSGVNFRQGLQEDLADINRGVGFGEDGQFALFEHSVLADQIYLGLFVTLSPTDHLRYVEEPIRIEKEMTNHFKNAVISTMLRDQMCYLHCTPEGMLDVNEAEISSSRFIPVAGTACQAQCWRNWRKGKTIEMYGVEELAESQDNWGVAMDEFVRGSFSHWQVNRLNHHDESLFPTFDEVLGGSAATSSGSYLPVCFSEVMAPQNFELGHPVNDRALPCSCGNLLGNETMPFFREAGFDHWVAAGDGKGLAKACMKSMSLLTVPPVQTYLTLCQIGWHFPTHHDPHHKLYRGPDEQCEAIATEASEIVQGGGNEWDLNCRLCFQSQAGLAVKESQRGRIGQLFPNRWNFARGCSEYERDGSTCFY